MDNALTFQELLKSQRELEAAYDLTLWGWAKAVELRDQETAGHTERVTELTLRLARALGVPEEDLDDIRRGPSSTTWASWPSPTPSSSSPAPSPRRSGPS